MQVNIKDFNVKMEIKTRGVELEVCDPDGTHHGDLVLTKTKVIWCPGRTSRPKGHTVTWKQFISLMEEL
jgi:hypothetical protein